MAKAVVEFRNGATAELSGTPQEVADLIALLNGGEALAAAQGGEGRTLRTPTGEKGSSKKSRRVTRKGPKALITELVGEGFFKSRQTISSVQKQLEQQGHIYPLTHLSTPLIRLTRDKVLRRIKENKGWVYVE